MNFNQAIIAGNVTHEPELRSLPSGTQVCELRIATHRTFTSQGQKQEETEFHNVVIWGKQADIAARYLKKGALVLVRGRLRTRTWDDKNGSKQYKTEIIADTFELGPKTHKLNQEAMPSLEAEGEPAEMPRSSSSYA